MATKLPQHIIYERRVCGILKKLREEQGLSPEEAANKADLPVSAVEYADKHGAVTIGVLYRYAKALGRELQISFTQEEDKQGQGPRKETK